MLWTGKMFAKGQKQYMFAQLGLYNCVHISVALCPMQTKSYK